MRKGFTLTLTALATVFTVTSAVAMGPTVKPIPDVYISNTGETYSFTNMFRYSQALTLWQYVEAGVTTGAGSTSDTLYWAYALKNATLSGGTGSYLDPVGDPTSIHYSIIQENDVNGLLLGPTKEVGAAGWGAEINNAMIAQGSALNNYTVAAAGALTFRNIRLSPPPDADSYSTPTAAAGAPAGYLDAQEATVYVSDTTTTDLGTAKFLLLTIDGGVDSLSGGPSFTMIQDYSASLTGFTSFSLIASIADSAAAGTVPGTGIVQSIAGGTMTITTPINESPAGNYTYAQYTINYPGIVDTANLYRVKATLSSNNATAVANPHVYVGLNGRTSSGYGWTQIQVSTGPTSTPQTYSGYLAPVEPGYPQPIIAVYDPGATYGGTETITGVQLMSVPLADVLAAATPVATYDTFNVGTDWNSLAVGFVGTGLSSPVFTFTPATATVGAADLVINSTTNATQQGFASFEGPAISVAAGQLYVVTYTLSTSASNSATLPTVWMNVGSSVLANLMVQRDTAGTAGPTGTAKDYYVAWEAPENANANINFRVVADQANISGDVRCSKIVVSQLDVPAAP